MDKKKENEVIGNMVKLSNQISENIEQRGKTIDGMQYYNDFQFEKVGIGLEGAFVVKLKDDTTPEKQVKDRKEDSIKDDTLYEIYDKDNNLVAMVSEDGKIHFDEQFLEDLKENNEGYFNTLDLEENEFELPEKTERDDLSLSGEELEKVKNDKKLEEVSKFIDSENIQSYSEMKTDQTPIFDRTTNKQEIDPNVMVTRDRNFSRYDSRNKRKRNCKNWSCIFR